MAEVIDAVLYFNEVELFCARYDLLKDVVDRFCVFESGCTFTGQPKVNDFWSDLARIGVQVDARRISYLRVAELPDQLAAQEIPELAAECQRVARLGEGMGAQWFKEHLSREWMKRTFADASDDAVVLISDVDEIPTPDAVRSAAKLIEQDPRAIASIPMRDYVGSIACETGKNWEGTFVMTKRLAVDVCLSMVRTLDSATGQRTYPGVIRSLPGGWHFSSFGGRDTVERKIRAWGHQELNRWDIRWFLGANLALGRDIFGRDLRKSRRGGHEGSDRLNPHRYFDRSMVYHAFIFGNQRPSIKHWLLRGCFVGVQVVRRVLARVGCQQA